MDLFATANDRADKAHIKQYCNLQVHFSITGADLLRTTVGEVLETILVLDDS